MADRGEHGSARRPRAGARPVAVVLLAIVGVSSLALSVRPPVAGAAFPTGDAQASADTFSLNLKAANATIGFTYGRSIAGYQDRTGTSEARALDLGALPTLFGGVQCDGSPPLLNPVTLPPLTRADSTDDGSDRSRQTQVFLPGLNGAPAGTSVGVQDATATRAPSSKAVTHSARADVGLIALDGGATEVTTQLVGHVREAHAVVTADSLRVVGNLFTFTKPRWEAVARTGDKTGATGSFTFERATVLGVPRSPSEAMADLQGFKTQLEHLLAPLGIVLDLPQVVVREDGVKVTPMGFRVVNPPIGTQFLIPFLGRIDPIIQTLRQQAVAADCKNQTVLTVIDVLLGVLGGSGAIEMLAGGVDVATHATDYSVPPTTASTTVPETTSPPVEVAPESLALGDTFDPGTSDLGYSDLNTPVDGSLTDLSTTDLGTTSGAPVTVARRTETAALPAASLDRVEPGSAGKAGVAVGLLALVGAVGLSVGDRLVGRRGTRRIP